MAAAATARRALFRRVYHYEASLARASDLDAMPSSSTASFVQRRSNQVRGVSQMLSKSSGKVFDLSALVTKLEAQGIPSKQAEVIASVIIEGLKDNLENERHFSTQQQETERLKNDIEKLHTELKYEIGKVTAGLRLDLNLERGRTRDELASQSTETSELTNKLDREIHALRAQHEAAKYDIIKYCIGTVFSFTAAGLAVIRILL